MSDHDEALAAAVKEQAQSTDKHFVFVTRANRNLPGLRQALAEVARESGRMLVEERAELESERVQRENVKNRAFIKNLAKIANGEH